MAKSLIASMTANNMNCGSLGSGKALKNMPVIAIAPNDELLEKLKSNLQEVHARGGELYVFTDSVKSEENNIHIIEMPVVDKILAPIAYTIPLQLLAYHVAVLKGTDVDQPRNLAKSVTVE